MLLPGAARLRPRESAGVREIRRQRRLPAWQPRPPAAAARARPPLAMFPRQTAWAACTRFVQLNRGPLYGHMYILVSDMCV